MTKGALITRPVDFNTNFEPFSTLLFINRGTVKAYSIIESVDTDFDSSEVEGHYTFPKVHNGQGKEYSYLQQITFSRINYFNFQSVSDKQ